MQRRWTNLTGILQYGEVDVFTLHLLGRGENHFTVIIILYHDPCTGIHHKPTRARRKLVRANNKAIVNLDERETFRDVYRSGALLVEVAAEENLTY